MKAVQTVLVLLLMACYTQAYIGWLVRRADGLYTEVVNLVDALDENVDLIREHLTHFSESVSDSIDNTMAVVREDVLDGLTDWRASLQEAARTARSMGLDFRSCAIPANSLERIALSMITDARACLAEHKHSCDEVQDEALVLVDELEDLLDNIDDSLRECDDGDKEDRVECLAEHLSPFANQARAFIDDASDAVKDLGSLIKDTSLEIAKCASSSLAKHGAVAVRLVTNAVSCVKQGVLDATN